MARRKYRPITLFLCLLLRGFIILGPIYFLEYRPEYPYKDPTKKEVTWKGVITLWDYSRLDVTNGSCYGWIISKIKQFERENPGVFMELKPMDGKTGPIELDTAIQMKMYPNIAPVATDFSVIDRDVVEPVDEYLTREELEDYKVQALNAVRYKGKTWGFPWMMTTYTMLLNLDLFHEKGVDPPKDGNWTYDEFMETIEHLHLKLIGFMKIQNYNFLNCIYII